MKRKVIVYLGMSVDGFIARKNGELDWLEAYESKDQDYGYAAFMKRIDTVIMGRRTYEKVMSMVPVFPHGDKRAYVISSTLQQDKPVPEVFSGDPVELIRTLKREEGLGILVDGGAALIHTLKEAGEIDEYVLSIIPVLLGEGIRLFPDGKVEEKLELINTRMYENGLIQLRYRVKRE